MTSRQLLTLAARAEQLGPFVGDRDTVKARDLARECRERANVRMLFESLEGAE